MKKLLCTLAVLTCAINLVSCGSSSSSSESVTTQTTTQTTTNAEPQTATPNETVSKTTEATTIEATTTPTIEETTEASEEQVAVPESSNEFVEIIGKDLEITNITEMAAEMIGAEEGTSFKYNGNKFEIYRFKSDDPKIEQAKSGSLSYTIESIGEFTSKSSVNGNYVMIYDTPEDKVIEAFERIS